MIIKKLGLILKSLFYKYSCIIITSIKNLGSLLGGWLSRYPCPLVIYLLGEKISICPNCFPSINDFVYLSTLLLNFPSWRVWVRLMPPLVIANFFCLFKEWSNGWFWEKGFGNQTQACLIRVRLSHFSQNIGAQNRCCKDERLGAAIATKGRSRSYLQPCKWKQFLDLDAGE